MSRHAATIALAARVRALHPRLASLAADLAALGGDMVSEAPALSVLDRLVTQLGRLTAAARDAERLLTVADRTGQIDETAGRAVLERLRAAVGEP